MNGASDNLAQLAGGRRTELSPGSGLGVVFSRSLLDLLSLCALYQELSGPSLDRGNKTQTAWCVASDCSGLDLVM